MIAAHPVYRALASIVVARLNCLASNEQPHPWTDRHEDRIKELMGSAPSGSGIDCGTKIDLDASNGAKLVFNVSYHHMAESGMYDGWTEHVLTVMPTFDGVDIRISGRNRNDIKEYLYEVYHYWLTQPCGGE